MSKINSLDLSQDQLCKAVEFYLNSELFHEEEFVVRIDSYDAGLSAVTVNFKQDEEASK